MLGLARSWHGPCKGLLHPPTCTSELSDPLSGAVRGMLLHSTGIRALEELFRRWDSCDGPIRLRTLKRAVAELPLEREDFEPFIRFSDSCYQRCLLHRGPAYEALVLSWRSGQRSPIHDHAGSACVLRVLEGVATETIFAPSPCGQLFPTRSRSARAGAIRASFDSDIHQLANLEPPGHDLVTLHVYSPPLARMRTYRVDETTAAVDAVAGPLIPRVIAERPIEGWPSEKLEFMFCAGI